MPWSRADFNGDGTVSSADLSMLNGADGDAIAADPLVTHPTLSSSRGRDRNGVAVTGLALCDHGHQGLLHDREFGLVYNRARYLHPRLMRFTQRDPLGYIDGMGLYECYGSNGITGRDPSACWTQPCPSCSNPTRGWHTTSLRRTRERVSYRGRQAVTVLSRP